MRIHLCSIALITAGLIFIAGLFADPSTTSQPSSRPAGQGVCIEEEMVIQESDTTIGPSRSKTWIKGNLSRTDYDIFERKISEINFPDGRSALLWHDSKEYKLKAAPKSSSTAKVQPEDRPPNTTTGPVQEWINLNKSETIGGFVAEAYRSVSPTASGGEMIWTYWFVDDYPDGDAIEKAISAYWSYAAPMDRQGVPIKRPKGFAIRMEIELPEDNSRSIRNILSARLIEIDDKMFEVPEEYTEVD